MFGAVLRESNPIVMGSLAIILSVLAVETCVSAFRPVAAVPVFVFRAQQLGEIAVVLALIGGTISGIGGGVTLVSGVQDHPAGFQALGKGFLPSRHGGLASFEVRTLIG